MQRALHSTKRIWALALIVGHLLAVAMAWSPSLHHWAHGHAAEPHHTCAITAVLAGQLDQPGITAITTAPPLLAEEAQPSFETDRRPPGVIRDCGRERAPPRA